MRVLVACEYSGTVRDAFLDRGHDAISCDLLPSDSDRGEHYQGDVFDLVGESFDLVVAHPPCTYFSLAGNRWLNHPKHPDRLHHRAEALEFWNRLWLAFDGTPRAFENPRGTISTLFRRPDQTVFPWEFGNPQDKTVCLWLDSLPPLIRTGPLVSTDRIYLTNSNGEIYTDTRWHYETRLLPNAERQKARSRFFPGIAEAMALQWGSLRRSGKC